MLGLVLLGAAGGGGWWNLAQRRGATWVDLVPSVALARWPEPWPDAVEAELAQRVAHGTIGRRSIAALIDRLIPWIDAGANGAAGTGDTRRWPTSSRIERIDLLAAVLEVWSGRWRFDVTRTGIPRGGPTPRQQRAIAEAVGRAARDGRQAFRLVEPPLGRRMPTLVEPAWLAAPGLIAAYADEVAAMANPYASLVPPAWRQHWATEHVAFTGWLARGEDVGGPRGLLERVGLDGLLGADAEAALLERLDASRDDVRSLAQQLLLARRVIEGRAPGEVLGSFAADRGDPTRPQVLACRFAGDDPRAGTILVAALADGPGARAREAALHDLALFVIGERGEATDALRAVVRPFVEALDEDTTMWRLTSVARAWATLAGDEAAAALLVGPIDPERDPSQLGLLVLTFLRLGAPRAAARLEDLLEVEVGMSDNARRHRLAAAMLHLGGDAERATEVLLETARIHYLEIRSAAVLLLLNDHYADRVELDLVVRALGELPIAPPGPAADAGRWGDDHQAAVSLACGLHFPVLWRAAGEARPHLPALRAIRDRWSDGRHRRSLDLVMEWIALDPERPARRRPGSLERW